MPSSRALGASTSVAQCAASYLHAMPVRAACRCRAKYQRDPHPPQRRRLHRRTAGRLTGMAILCPQWGSWTRVTLALLAQPVALGFHISHPGRSAACRTQRPSSGQYQAPMCRRSSRSGVDGRLGRTMPSHNPLVRSSAPADARRAVVARAEAAPMARHRQESRTRRILRTPRGESK